MSLNLNFLIRDGEVVVRKIGTEQDLGSQCEIRQSAPVCGIGCISLFLYVPQDLLSAFWGGKVRRNSSSLSHSAARGVPLDT